MALSADEPPKATINCQVIELLEEPGRWYVHVGTQEFDGKRVMRADDKSYKSLEKAQKQCTRIVKQWKNLYNPKKRKK